MDINSVKVSIIIPVYNVEQYLPDCLNSILSQSLQDIEVICVNDAATDNSGRIIEEYSRNDARVISIGYTTNKGQAYARNRGLEIARGKYIYFVDADDMVKEGALEHFYNAMEEEKLEGLLFSAEVISEIEARVDLDSELRHKSYSGIYKGTEMFSLLVDNADYSHNVWRQFWSREYLESHALRFHEETSPHEDLLFSFKAILSSQRLKCINYVGYVCRKRPGSITTTNPNLKKLKAFITCYGESLQFIQENQQIITEKMAVQLGTFFSLEKTYVVNTALFLCRQGFDMRKLDIANGFYGFVLKAFIFNRYQHIAEFLPVEIYEKIRSCKHIIIYGAGKVGHEVADQLSRYGIAEYVFAETQKSGRMDGTGIRICSLEELAPYAHDSMVLVSVTSKYKEEMIKHLKEVGFSNYACMCEERKVQ